MMPDEFALQLVELDQLGVQLAGNVGLPVFGYAGKFLGEVGLIEHGG
jgi:hypothetical protein